MTAPIASVYQWHKLGRFRVLWRPLPSAEIWTTHWIYLNGRLIGKQLSVPTIDDCNWHLRRAGVYAEHHESHRHSGGYVCRGKRLA